MGCNSAWGPSWRPHSKWWQGPTGGGGHPGRLYADETLGQDRLRVDFQHPQPAVCDGTGAAVVDGFWATISPVCWHTPSTTVRDIHDLRSLYPGGSLSQWADAVHQLYRQATAFTHPAEQQRRTAKMALERRLLVLAVPFWMTRRRSRPGCADAWRTTSKNSSSSWPNRRCRRTTTPPSAASAIWCSAARSVGAPARTGVLPPRTLASIFGTWRAQGLNTLNACRQLLASPQV